MRIISILQGFSSVASRAVLFLATVAGAVQPCVDVPLPGVKDIFSMSVSPAGAALAFYGSHELVDGEVAIGRPYWIS